MDAVLQQIPKLLHPVVLPVVNTELELLHSLVEQVAVDRLVRLCQHALGCVHSRDQVRLRGFVLALLRQVLKRVRSRSKGQVNTAD